MADLDDNVVPVLKKRIVHYGTLEKAAGATDCSTEAIRVGHVEVNQTETFALPEDARQKELMAEFERRKKARTLVVPTDDKDVRKRLRELNHPVTLFGEQFANRRKRLREILAEMGAETGLSVQDDQDPITRREADETTWYHEGSEILRKVRQEIAKYSLERARLRLQRQKKESETPESTYGLLSSQIGDTRPLSYCAFSPNCQLLAVSSWTGLVKLWSVPQCELVRTYRGHGHSAGGLSFHPEATKSLDPKLASLASCAVDGTVNLWNLVDEEPVQSLPKHEARVSRIAHHPSGNQLATCCFDNSWRLFDLNTNQEILFQEGHSMPVYDISLQCDGSLALTGGLDSYGRMWDLRTGRCVMFLNGHHRSILGVDFHPNGFQMATASEDNSAKVWDARKRDCVYTIPAHTGMLSQCVFQKTNGDYLATSSYDCSIKLWAHPGWSPLTALTAHESKVMAIDVSADNKYVASVSFDRTFKVWGND